MSNSLCILTDNSAQLPYGGFPGQRLIRSLQLHCDSRSVSAPKIDEFLHVYQELEREFSAILVLTLSSHLLSVAEIARQASMRHGGTARITVLDSRQAAAGLGMLAQVGAQAALAGATLTDVENRVRGAIPHIYNLIYIDPESLSHRDYLPAAEMNSDVLGPFPLFVLEDGQLVPYKRVRTRRHLLECFQEFIEEFETPSQIAFLRGKNSALRSRPLRDVAKTLFPETLFSELDMSAPLLALFGPQAVGITIMEMPAGQR